jgi:hypothetical protein
MGSDLVTNRSTGLSSDLSSDLSLERLVPAASQPALQGQIPDGEVNRKPRRRARSESEEEAEPEVSLGPGEEPEHKIDRLA